MEKEGSPLSQERTTTSSTSPIKWDYTCIFCDRSFDSGRALGGHQNAHRFERRESRRTHHKRVPKEGRPPVVSLPNPKNDSHHHHHGYPMAMTMQEEEGLPPRVGEYEWVARARQGMGAEVDLELKLNATNADGVEEVDLELKL